MQSVILVDKIKNKKRRMSVARKSLYTGYSIMVVSLITAISRKLLCVVFFNDLLVELSELLNIVRILWSSNDRGFLLIALIQKCCEADSG